MTGKAKACISSVLQQKHGWSWSKRPTPPTLPLERKKMTKKYMKLFMILLNITVLNCMVIWRANSGQTKIDHFKFRVELVQALRIEYGSERVRKFQGHHSTEKMCNDLLKDIFQREYHRQKRRPGQQRGV